MINHWIYIKAAAVVDNEEDECTFAYALNHGGIGWGESTLGAWSRGYVCNGGGGKKKKTKQKNKKNKTKKASHKERFLETYVLFT